ncbi:DmsE family decaheme c-type cytochrome [Edaphobacter aggregans]|uniref:DmsE family decaheme c-type cytochrome n=1 Tax=Edaphobacter aggregans TaxID=570835 RepID=UPI000A03B937|nr:DmsE family decaheme c-type cytochrome [Edaphobacter aggregans]
MRPSRSSVAILALLSWFGAASLTHVASAAQSQAVVSSPKPAVNPADYVGAEACATCHQDEVKGFNRNPHAKLALEHGGKGVTCESCHGPGKAHMESGGDATKIFQFTKATPKQVDDKCLSCHASAHPNFMRTAHGEAKIGCTSCHSAHKFETPTGMLKAKEPNLCYQCHTDVKSSFMQPFHHKVDEGLMKCSDCHDAHGTFQPKMLHTSATQDAICTKCHVDTLGPFVYQHPPVQTEGCVSCHFPHGSANPRLLTRNNVNSLCLQCHSPSMTFTAPAPPSFHNQANQYQNCTICHVQIHGSNVNKDFFK